MKFEAQLDNAIQARKGRSAKAIKALLDLDTLRASRDQEADLQAALDGLAKESGYLFDAGAPRPGMPGDPARPAGAGPGEVPGAGVPGTAGAEAGKTRNFMNS